jgi:flavodoxin
MDPIIIAYWTQTGNTKAMAEAVGEGVEMAGKKADVRHISEVSMDRLKEAQAFALGCPAMGPRCWRRGRWSPL